VSGFARAFAALKCGGKESAVDFLLRNVLIADRRDPVSIAVRDGRIVSVSCDPVAESFETVFSFPNCLVLPGLADVDVHFREPVFLIKRLFDRGRAGPRTAGIPPSARCPTCRPVRTIWRALRRS
jgi:hypothetical protein